MFTSAPKFALVLILTTLALFLFPAASGSFTATHGPTTALRAITRFRALLASIAAWTIMMAGRVLLSKRAYANSEPVAGLVSSEMLSLRC
jgi:hypothetical protein